METMTTKKVRFNSYKIEQLKEQYEKAETIDIELRIGVEHHGLSFTHYGKYVVVDDGSDRWLCETDEYQEALDDILDAAFTKPNYDESEAYNNLCNQCSAMYSNIGSGEYNNNTDELREILGETLNDEEIDDMFRELLIEVDETD